MNENTKNLWIKLANEIEEELKKSQDDRQEGEINALELAEMRGISTPRARRLLNALVKSGKAEKRLGTINATSGYWYKMI